MTGSVQQPVIGIKFSATSASGPKRVRLRVSNQTTRRAQCTAWRPARLPPSITLHPQIERQQTIGISVSHFLLSFFPDMSKRISMKFKLLFYLHCSCTLRAASMLRHAKANSNNNSHNRTWCANLFIHNFAKGFIYRRRHPMNFAITCPSNCAIREYGISYVCSFVPVLASGFASFAGYLRPTRDRVANWFSNDFGLPHETRSIKVR